MPIHTQQRGFSLIELLVTLAILGILVSIAYPRYISYVQGAYRRKAQVALLDLASHLENYYVGHQSYLGATLAAVGVDAYTESGRYQLAILQATDSYYLIKAVPQNAQTQDQLCGTLTLDALGKKGVSGTGGVGACW